MPTASLKKDKKKTHAGTLLNVIQLELQQCEELPSGFVCSEKRVILPCVISSFPCLAAAALAACSLWPVSAVMCLKFKPVGDRGGCCSVSVLLMGKRRRGKGTETPGERANKKRLEDEKRHVMETGERESNGDL